MDTDREDEDVGVKFVAWGKTPDRLYTGSSDGIVRVWNVRADRQPHLRDILEVPGAISFGTFNPDFSRLLIGDSTGRVSLISSHELDEKPDNFVTLGGRKIRRPQLVIPFKESKKLSQDTLRQNVDANMSGRDRAREWLQSGAIKISRYGAVQGPNYDRDIGLYDRKSHLDLDPYKPLEARVQCVQQEERDDHIYPDLRKLGLECQKQRCERLQQFVSDCTKVRQEEFERELAKQFDKAGLEPDTRVSLDAERAVLEVDDYDFSYEDDVEDDFWENHDDHGR